MSWRSNPDNIKAYMKNYHRQQYLQRKDAGLCTKCGKRPARTGRTLCDECVLRRKKLFSKGGVVND